MHPTSPTYSPEATAFVASLHSLAGSITDNMADLRFDPLFSDAEVASEYKLLAAVEALLACEADLAAHL